ncbi:hypothetical protein [Paenibacillus sp. BIC5C1]|uniref:hypothetical protein n=1 Tax=Paenibacillus sp. BIC5C1 TaxID=3078263 RepID=UPI0028E95C11|nr:hypothetical protein [Paenibacillus sp. BIC5C1]
MISVKITGMFMLVAIFIWVGTYVLRTSPKEWFIYSAIVVIAGGLGVLKLLRWGPPTPLVLVSWILHPLSQFISNLQNM